MHLKRIHIELDVSDVQRILAIALDDNAEDALAFVREDLARKVQKALQRH